MSNGGSLQPRPTKNEKREAAREKARQLREEQARKDKRRRLIWQLSAIVGVVAIAAGLFFGYQAYQKSQLSASAGPANMLSDGLVVTAKGPVLTAAIPAGGSPVATKQDTSSNAVNIVIYYDYLCPYCGEFEAANNAYIQQLVQNGATLEMHPIAILTDKSQGTRYSERAANAFACVAANDPNVAVAFSSLLFANQPEEGTSGLSDSQLKNFVTQAGSTNAQVIGTCIDNQTYKNWVQSATNRALNNTSLRDSQGNFGTPRVLINGNLFSGSPSDANEFKAFVVQATSETSSTASPTPTPTQ